MKRSNGPAVARRDQLVCSYLAMSYVLDRHAAFTIEEPSLPRPIASLAAGLLQPDRRVRAQALATALAPIVRALDRRRIA
jgi:hypothetical protein